MLDNFFQSLAEKNIVKQTKQILMLDNCGCNIWKAKDKETRDIILMQLQSNGVEVQKNKENKVYCLFFQGYFAGVLSY